MMDTKPYIITLAHHAWDDYNDPYKGIKENKRNLIIQKPQCYNIEPLDLVPE